MNFDFSDEQKMLRDQVRRFLKDNASADENRKILESDEPFDRDLWKKIVDMGWTATVIPEECGGLGLGHLELCVIAEELGRAITATPFSSSVYLATEAIMAFGSEAQKSNWLPKLASGEVIGTLAHAEGGGVPSPRTTEVTVSGGKLFGTKMPVPDGDIADVAIVSVKTGSDDSEGSISLYIVNLEGSGVSREAVKTFDPSRSHASITFDGAEAELLGQEGHGWDGVTTIMDRAAVLVGFEQLGGASVCLEIAKEYALERYAFGRPIGSMQAIKHKLADMYTAVELARSNCYYGAWALSSDAAELGVAAATARISATQAFHECSKENIQVHGGIGYTWESDCHLYYRRSKLLALNLGSEARWKDTLIDRLEARNVA